MSEGAFRIPDTLEINEVAEVEKGLFVTIDIVKHRRTTEKQVFYLRMEKSNQILGCNGLQGYMCARRPSGLNSINQTVYLNAVSKDGEEQVLYYKNSSEYGDITEQFKRHGIKVSELAGEINGSLLIEKEIVYEQYHFRILQVYNPETDTLINVGKNGKPIEINPYPYSFTEDGYFYFIGNDGINEDALWRYNGVDEPERIKVTHKE